VIYKCNKYPKLNERPVSNTTKTPLDTMGMTTYFRFFDMELVEGEEYKVVQRQIYTLSCPTRKSFILILWKQYWLACLSWEIVIWIRRQ